MENKTTMKIFQTIPVLPSTDFDQTAQFYELLGFRGLRSYPDYLILKCDEQEIHFFLEEGDPTYGHGHSHFSTYIRAVGVDELYTRLAAAGVTVEPPADRPWGLKELVVIDPDGSMLRFGESINS
jgi:catechol 2,3-dioxygenase-like lactoylglutathione lyase family enzyme